MNTTLETAPVGSPEITPPDLGRAQNNQDGSPKAKRRRKRKSTDHNDSVDPNQISLFADLPPAPVAPQPVKPSVAPRAGGFPVDYTPAAMQTWSRDIEGHLDPANPVAALERCDAELDAVDLLHRTYTTGRLAGAIVAAQMIARNLCPPQCKNAAKYVRQLLASKAFARSATACSRLPKAGAMWIEGGKRGLLQASAPDPYFPFCSDKVAAQFDPVERWGELCRALGRTPTEMESRKYVTQLLGRTPPPGKAAFVRIPTLEFEGAMAMLESGRTAEALAALRSWNADIVSKGGANT